MGARKLAAVFLLSLALLLPIGFCAWNQTLVVNVTDQNGLPISGASVKIIYQKANGITSDDGLTEGYTGDSGIYLANLTNTVPEGLESRKIVLNVSASQWAGEQKEVEAGGGAAIDVQFTAQVALEKVTIIVLQPDGKEAPGASIYITGSPTKRTADSAGRAVVYIAAGSEITGFASYKSEGDYFSSASATTGADGGKEILVRLASQAGGGGTKANKTAVSVKFISIDNSPVSGEKILFYADGIETPSYTNALGIATVSVSETGELRAAIRKNDYDYIFLFNITADGIAKEETAVLSPLLKIDYFESRPDGIDCYQLSAKVSDPRTSRPISIKIIPIQNGTEMGELPVTLDDNGLYTVRVCAGADATVKAVASNAYEIVEKTISLVYTPPPPPPPVQANATPVGNGTQLPQPVAPSSPTEGLGVVAIAIVLLVIVFGAAVAVLGKKSPESTGGLAKYFAHTWGMLLGSTVRPIIEYLHSIFRKKEPPPPFGQGSMMPPA